MGRYAKQLWPLKIYVVRKKNIQPLKILATLRQEKSPKVQGRRCLFYQNRIWQPHYVTIHCLPSHLIQISLVQHRILSISLKAHDYSPSFHPILLPAHIRRKMLRQMLFMIQESDDPTCVLFQLIVEFLFSEFTSIKTEQHFLHLNREWNRTFFCSGTANSLQSIEMKQTFGLASACI